MSSSTSSISTSSTVHWIPEILSISESIAKIYSIETRGGTILRMYSWSESDKDWSDSRVYWGDPEGAPVTEKPSIKEIKDTGGRIAKIVLEKSEIKEITSDKGEIYQIL